MDHYLKAVGAYATHAIEQLRAVIDRDGKTASPIERGFLTGLVGRWMLTRTWAFAGTVFQPTEAEYVGEVHMQYPVENFRLDFAVHLRWSGSGRTQEEWIAIECDGHDFHERTKLQAQHDRSRDRLLTAQGWKVFRFTGSEIYRDVVQCTLEVENYIVDRVESWRGSELAG